MTEQPQARLLRALGVKPWAEKVEFALCPATVTERWAHSNSTWDIKVWRLCENRVPVVDFCPLHSRDVK